MEAANDPRLLKGVEQFNQGLYFECHESLEEIWLEEHGEDRKFYQGIIQVSAGYYKWEQGVLIGAIKLWRSGLEKLELYGETHLGLDMGSFIAGIKRNLEELEAIYQAGGECPTLNVPVLGKIS